MTNPPHDVAPLAPELPTPLIKDWVYYLLGFGVAVGMGLAVWLGKIGVPLFSPLLDVIPNDLRTTLIPLSSTLMGVVAVAVQFYANRRARTDRLFVLGLVIALAGFVALVVAQRKLVVAIETTPGNRATFLVCSSLPQKAPCVGVSKAECIERLTFNPSVIRSFFGDSCLETAELILVFAYLLFMASFGSLVGMVVARRRNQLRRARPAIRTALAIALTSMTLAEAASAEEPSAAEIAFEQTSISLYRDRVVGARSSAEQAAQSLRRLPGVDNHAFGGEDFVYDITQVRLLISRFKAQYLAAFAEPQYESIRDYLSREFARVNDSGLPTKRWEGLTVTGSTRVEALFSDLRSIVRALDDPSRFQIVVYVRTPIDAAIEVRPQYVVEPPLDAMPPVRFATNRHLPPLFRGRYIYRILKDGYKVIESPLDLVRFDAAGLDCTLNEVGSKEGPYACTNLVIVPQ